MDINNNNNNVGEEMKEEDFSTETINARSMDQETLHEHTSLQHQQIILFNKKHP